MRARARESARASEREKDLHVGLWDDGLQYLAFEQSKHMRLTRPPPPRTMHCTRCPPCRGYTPELASSYTSIVAMGKSFEIVFVSSDQDEPAFQSYFAEMPWLALPFADRLTKQALSDI